MVRLPTFARVNLHVRHCLARQRVPSRVSERNIEHVSPSPLGKRPGSSIAKQSVVQVG